MTFPKIHKQKDGTDDPMCQTPNVVLTNLTTDDEEVSCAHCLKQIEEAVDQNPHVPKHKKRRVKAKWLFMPPKDTKAGKEFRL